jgi:hypothetical protein
VKGAFVFVVDVELAWGCMECVRIDEKRLAAVAKVREILQPLFKLLRDYEISATWAVLGHLFLDSCECKGRPHPEMPRPNYSWFEGDWYKYDPCSNIREAPLWYGKDIVEEITRFAQESPVDQEIGCHSFSHVFFGDPGCDEKLAAAEIDKTLELMTGFGIRPEFFAFPLGSVGHLAVLKGRGFTAFFSGVPQLIKGASLGRAAPGAFQKYVSSFIELSSNLLLLSPPVCIPEKVPYGLWNVRGSLCFNKKRFLPLDFVVLRAKKGIERAIKEKGCFYLYTHLENFGLDSIALLRGFEEVLSFVDERRKEGKLEVLTVSGLVKRYQS